MFQRIAVPRAISYVLSICLSLRIVSFTFCFSCIVADPVCRCLVCATVCVLLEWQARVM